MTIPKFPPEFLKKIKKITKKRAKTVIDHIVKKGFITTEELEKKYGYNHPPRAARDVREEGIPLETFRVKNSSGRSIAAYKFADISKVQDDKLGGRRIFSKEFKSKLISETGCKCSICIEKYEDRYLQVDHRIPYEVIGDVGEGERDTAEYMLICGSCNRAKSWSCEHCENWLNEKDKTICSVCYWTHPNTYKHIALRPTRRLDIVWSDDEVKVYDKLRSQAEKVNKKMPDYVKNIIEKHLRKST